MKKWIAVVVVLALALVAIGCVESNEMRRALDGPGDSIDEDLRSEWSEQTGESISGSTDQIPRSDMSESHAVMAAFILSGREMDSNLDSYKEVYLVEFKDAEGVERAAVYADGKLVLPAGAGQ
ncbi:MAG: hypothetical protein ACYC2X_04395 [Coriobacteriia bacterium]